MRAKEKMYLVMYAPNADYTTEDARVRVTARSVDGVSPASGYGLIVHGEKSSGRRSRGLRAIDLHRQRTSVPGSAP